MEPQPEAPRPPAMSVIARFSNIIAAPSEVFDDVKASTASTANWLAPTLILIVISWIATALIFATPAIQQQIRDMTDQALQKQFAGANLPQDKMEQAKETATHIARISQTIGAYVGIPIVVFFSTFVWGLILWLLGVKACKGNFTFMKAVEVAGLANVIGMLDSVIRTLLILVMGNVFASPSLMLLVKGFDPENTLHGALGKIEIFTLWSLGVLAIGLARLSGASMAKAAAWVFGIWVAYTGFFIGAGALFKAVMAQIGQHH
jgi:hypothetical protein